MKLSDVRGERCIEVIADIIEPVASIAQDEEAAALFRREKCPEGMEPSEFVLRRVTASLPRLLRGHKADVVAVLAAIEGVTAEEYADGMTLASLVRDVAELLTDEEFAAFFA